MYYIKKSGCVLRTSDSAEIPPDPSNTDWCAYLAWVDAGNKAAPYIEPASSAIGPVTSLQAKAALLQAGLLDMAEAHFAQPTIDPLARLAWAEATTFERDSRLVAATAAALGLTPNQVDDLFRNADRIRV